ncbi:hypothetical protein BC833DRAFT_571694 [Globomyces pollinis-pini]|nr:hypothetical protein BC833DRAFT_571694 [Globomyces pollinis-pini]
MVYPGEIEIAPGIYLTKKADLPKKPTAIAEIQKANKEFLQSNPKEYYEYLLNENKSLERSIEMLEFSNKEMFDQDENDPIYIESIAENIIVIERQQAAIVANQKKVKQLASTLGICFQEVVNTNESNDVNGDADMNTEDGVYL